MDPILRLLNLQLQRWRCSRLERFKVSESIFFILKTCYAISCVVNFYTAGVVTRDRMIDCMVVSCNVSAVTNYNE
jgi:hypothetical protein